MPQILDAVGVGLERAQASVADYVRFVMASDRKLGAMKALQVRLPGDDNGELNIRLWVRDRRNAIRIFEFCEEYRVFDRAIFAQSCRISSRVGWLSIRRVNLLSLVLAINVT